MNPEPEKVKYCIKVGNETFPIAEDEMPKIVEAMSTKSIVILKCGVIHGSFIRGIVRDIHGERFWNYGYMPRGEDRIQRKDYLTDIPANIGKLLESKNPIRK